MTKHEAAVVMAYTGIAMCCGDNWGVYHKYVQDIMGRPIWTHEMGDEKVAKQIKELSKPDFIELCKNLTDDLNVAPVVHGRWVLNKYYSPQCTNCGAHPFKGYIPTLEEVSRVYKYWRENG